MHKFSFLELQKSLFLDKSQIPKTFGDVDIDNNKFADENITDLTEFEEQLPKSLTQELVQYINDKALEMERNYMNNGLPEQEV